MNFKQAKARWESLRTSIDACNKAYYVDNNPSISDFEYDLLMQELQTLERNFPELSGSDSPTQNVGSDLDEVHFAKIAHRYPMLSLSNTYDTSELLEFDSRVRRGLNSENVQYVCELKFDGTAICLSYENGVLTRALTRGDGTVGDDVTENIKRISSIPLKLLGNFPPQFEIRGEILLPIERFKQINAERETAGEPLFANPRNAAAGTLKQIDPDVVKRRGLTCFLYHLIATPMPSPLHSQCLESAKTWGLPVSDHIRICNNTDEIFDFLNYWEQERHNLNVATDGVVIKVNKLAQQQELGMTAKSPRWATAYKFRPEQALTPLLSVSFQVGRTGAVTPVANLKPVQLSGTIVKRASLHNADQIALLDLREGDWVYVEKGGEIIPKVTGVDLKHRQDDAPPVKFITTCPQCGTALVKDPGEARHYCPNSWECPPQIMGRILHFMSRKAMNILGGESLVEQLYNKGLVKDASDLYYLSPLQLSSLENWGEKSTANLLQSIQKSKQLPFHRVLYGIGIPFVGETTAKYLASHFGSLEELRAADTESLKDAPEVGAIVAAGIQDFFSRPQNITIIARLREAGLEMENSRQEEVLSNKLEGLSFVVSGIFSRSRDEIKQIIEAHGGTVAGSLSAKTSYLLAGEKMGPAKKDKAEKTGIAIISESQLYNILEIPDTSEQTLL